VAFVGGIRAILIIAILASNVVYGSEKYAEHTRVNLAKLALKQSLKLSHDWDKSQHDCAGFIRYLFRKSVFKQGSFFKDRKGEPASYLSAKDLINYNFNLVTKDNFDLLKTGDVLAFYRKGVRINDSWHLMVVVNDVLKRSKKKLLVYHNGKREGGKENIKKVWLKDLQQLDAGAFQASITNENFLGVYRWNQYEIN
jgi:uncharacterized protein YfaT (DUF1175 family)